MNTILTDDEIRTAISEAGLQFTKPDDIVARAIEAAVLAKLREQEPVAVVKENPHCPEGESDEISTYLPAGMKLYAAPQPAVPPGWKLVPVNPTSEMLSQAHDWQGRRLPVAQYRAMLAVAPEAPAQPSVPARWSETVKVLREALQDALMLLEAYCDEGEVATRAQARAALAQLDSLEGGK